MATKPGDLLTAFDVAELIGAPVETVWRGCNGVNQIPKIRLGRLIRFRRSEVEKWLEANTRESFHVVERARRSA